MKYDIANLSVEERVNNGFEWFLKTWPEGLLKIDTGHFELWSCTNCALGQAFGEKDTAYLSEMGYKILEYRIGRVLGQDEFDAWAAYHGFYFPNMVGENEAQRLWVSRLNEYQKEHSLD